MSRIGKTPVKLPEGVKAEINKNKITISGKLGKLEYNLLDGISVREENGLLFVSRSDDTKEQKSFHGLTRALINNMVIGVSKGYEKVLQVIGTGYTAETVGPWLKLNVGYSHEILLEIPEGIKVEAQAIPRREQGPLQVQAVIKVSGIDKEKVGQFAAEIRHCRPPAPNLKGKGIRWEGERVRIVSKSSTQ
ncbi:MAG: 50S ribosomal protein L6 [Candidatus Cloacimonas sp. 4484_275]|nr:MAG: 50S ribosomal protein L6 [Candidatus Cloacimonas sp. 4484_275]